MTNARHCAGETQPSFASATPAPVVPGSPIEAKSRRMRATAQTLASTLVKPKNRLPGSPITKSRRTRATAQTPANFPMKPKIELPGSPLSTLVEQIRAAHRERRFAMGTQQVLDRRLESYVRVECVGWHAHDDETTRAKANEAALALIKAARKGEGDPNLIRIVKMSDDARAPADIERDRYEKRMEQLAKQLPVATWVDSVPGLGMLGLATIVAETGDLANYPNVAKVWKRLGYAPYHGLAGSTWKRPTWRNGQEALTAEEWIANPFSAKRYALLYVIAVWLKNTQWIGAKKTGTGVGKPNGPYGEIYAARRAHTATTNPNWTKIHSHNDALRIMMKAVLRDLWAHWNNKVR